MVQVYLLSGEEHTDSEQPVQPVGTKLFADY